MVRRVGLEGACFSLEEGITNAEFIVGKAEDVVPPLLGKYEDCEEFIAVVDPPRAGLRRSSHSYMAIDSPLVRLLKTNL